MALVQCKNCGNKMIEDEDTAILNCPYCNHGVIEVIEE